jgi:uncharacterized protein YlxW (UPF0749 family)
MTAIVRGFVFALCFALALIATPQAHAEKGTKKADEAAESSVPTPAPELRTEIDALRAELAALRTQVTQYAGTPAASAQSDQSVTSLRIALVIMGVGMVGGLVRLRQISKALSDLQNKE